MNTLTPCDRLRQIVARLRNPDDGCPWDRAQTLDSLRPYLVEETYEVIDTLERNDPKAHCDELGDLLLQIVFHAQLRSEEGLFDFDDVANASANKMERRHPHLFGAAEERRNIAHDPYDQDQLNRRWNDQKAKEGRKSALDGLPHAMPALYLARRLSEKAAGAGFDWRSVPSVLQKVDEERGELQEAIDSGNHYEMEAELGDLLFALTNLSRHLEIDPEAALRKAAWRFENRFRTMEATLKSEGKAVKDESDDELEARWQAAKRALRAANDPTECQSIKPSRSDKSQDP